VFDGEVIALTVAAVIALAGWFVGGTAIGTVGDRLLLGEEVDEGTHRGRFRGPFLTGDDRAAEVVVGRSEHQHPFEVVLADDRGEGH
jgi:hypothetical protein